METMKQLKPEPREPKVYTPKDIRDGIIPPCPMDKNATEMREWATTLAGAASGLSAKASELVGILWVESVANRANYTTANCANQPACLDWKNKVAASLPGSSTALSVDTTSGEVSITLTWNVPNEGQHSYVSRTNVLQ
jgi:hypothetical protein